MFAEMLNGELSLASADSYSYTAVSTSKHLAGMRRLDSVVELHLL